MRLLHTSDTHLGHQQYSRTDPDSGLNQREQDHYDTWRAFIDHAVQQRPDVVVHAGDLFDGVRPSNRALAAAMDGLLALSAAGIPVVLIAGNHEHPRMRETGSPFRLFEHIPGVHPVYKGRSESIRLDAGTIHAVPQCQDNQTLREQVVGLSNARAGPGPHVLSLHGAVASLPAFHHAEFNEQTLDPAWFGDFDYVALGHYHGVTEVTHNAWYCGAPDRVSIAESGERKGFLDVVVEPGQGPTVTPQPLPVRPYADLPVLDAAGMDAGSVVEAARAALRQVPAGAVARLRIEGIRADLRGVIDQGAIRDAAGHALVLDLRLGFEDTRRDVAGSVELGGLADELDAYAARQTLEGVDRAKVVATAKGLLAEGPA